MEPLTRVRKVQSITNLDDVINEHIGELESQGKIIKHIKFIDECVAFIIYKTPTRGICSELLENILKEEVDEECDYLSKSVISKMQ